MGRPAVTDITPAQRAALAQMVARNNRIREVLSTPRARAGAKFASYAETASEHLAMLRSLFAGGGDLLSEAAEIPLAVFLGSLANARETFAAEGLDLPTAAARRISLYREEYEGLKLVGGFRAS